MTYRGAVLVPLVLVALALMAGVLMEGVSGESSFVRRRLAEHLAFAAGGATTAPANTCPLQCRHTALPTCCRWRNIGFFPGPYYCANTARDYFNCGACGNVCPPYTNCCHGTCSFLPLDPNNCGFCGNKCRAGEICKGGLCDYAE